MNKRLEQISVERLFARITLYAHFKKNVGAPESRWGYEVDADAVEVQEDDQLSEEDEFFSDESQLFEDVDEHLHLNESKQPELEDKGGLK